MVLPKVLTFRFQQLVILHDLTEKLRATTIKVLGITET